jgi:hypothetical protein
VLRHHAQAFAGRFGHIEEVISRAEGQVVRQANALLREVDFAAFTRATAPR